jgi:hypothetical protein
MSLMIRATISRAGRLRANGRKLRGTEGREVSSNLFRLFEPAVSSYAHHLQARRSLAGENEVPVSVLPKVPPPSPFPAPI